MFYKRQTPCTIAELVGTQSNTAEAPNQRDRALRLGQQELTQILRTRRASATDNDISSKELYCAVLVGQTEIVRCCLDVGDDVLLKFARQECCNSLGQRGHDRTAPGPR